MVLAGNTSCNLSSLARLSLGNGDTLQIVFNNRQLTEKYAKGDSARELQEFLDGQTGKHITYETRFLEQEQEFEENYVDLQAIKFDIVTEEKEN